MIAILKKIPVWVWALLALSLLAGLALAIYTGWYAILAPILAVFGVGLQRQIEKEDRPRAVLEVEADRKKAIVEAQRLAKLAALRHAAEERKKQRRQERRQREREIEERSKTSDPEDLKKEILNWAREVNRE